MTPVWDYGDEGRAFPVKVNEVWAVGKHLFVCSDLMTSRGCDEVWWRPDPIRPWCTATRPWGQSSREQLPTEGGTEPGDLRWETLYDRIAQLAHDRYHLPVCWRAA